VSLRLGLLDGAIVLAYLIGTVAFGVWIGRRGGLTHYLVGGRDLPWWVILASIVATETSTVTFLSVPGFAFSRDLTFLQLPLGFVIGRYLAAWLLLPHYFRGELFTAYQVLEHRFGGWTKRLASALFVVTRCLADGLRLYLTAVPLYFIAGLDMNSSIVFIGLATIVYTFAGGMTAVVWTDFVQLLIYLAGASLACGLIIASLPGGWTQLAEFAWDHGKLRVFDWAIDLTKDYTIWAGLFGGTFVSLASHGADQLMVQRYLCARNVGDARRALTLSGWIVLLQFALFLLVGVALACFYHVHPATGEFSKDDEVFAAYMVNHMPAGALGITLAAVFAAAMSTLSSSLNSSATAAVNDLYVSATRTPVSPQRSLRATRMLTILFGLVQISVALVGQFMERRVVEQVLAIAAFTTGIVLGLFLLGVLTRSVTQPAALAALVGGLAAMTYLKFRTTLAWPWFAVVGAIGTLCLGLFASECLVRIRRYHVRIETS
jgi:SSS family transporter